VREASKDKLSVIQPNQNDFFYASGNKIQLKINQYDWSKPFDVTSIGLTGAVDLPREKSSSAKSSVITFGVLIENGAFPHSRTRIIRIVPRFIFVNKMKQAVVVR